MYSGLWRLSHADFSGTQEAIPFFRFVLTDVVSLMIISIMD